MISNLFDEAIAVSDLATDHRWKKWVKYVDEIDPAQSNGYAFKGDFVKQGTIEYTPAERLLLVAATTGSRNHQTTNYRIVRMHADGSLEATDIRDSDKERGWALRMRPQVEALLAEINQAEPVSPLAQYSTEDLLAELARRGVVVQQ
jgi:hypothetical protein